MASFNHESAFMRRLKNNTASSRALPGQVIVSNTSDSSNNNNHNISSQKSDTDESNKNEMLMSPIATTSSSMNNDSNHSSYKISQYNKILSADNIDLNNLRKLSWNGVPAKFRPDVWQLLLGYLPASKVRREAALQRKRQEYLDSIGVYFAVSEVDRTTQDGEILRQIQVDLPRTSPDTAFFQQEVVQRAMERILYIWSIRHPASGYVQGMNDLLTPLLLVCIQRYVDDPLRCDAAGLNPSIMSNVEADAYWCLTKLLDGIQDHYTFSQPGLQRMMLRLEDLIHRIDNELYTLFENECVNFQIFSFRWMNCALLRELPLHAVLRLWDTYFAEEQGGFENFHVYVCAVMLKTFRDQLLKLNGFQELVIFLQNLPTEEWGEREIEPILSQAFILSTLFDDSPNHLG